MLKEEILGQYVIAEKIRVESRFFADMRCIEANAKWETHVDNMARRLVMQLWSFVLAMPEESFDIEEKWPEDWWQAVRARWFPKWWLSRWPVRYKKISFHQKKYRVCPHVNIHSDEHQRHFQFLFKGK